MFSNVTDRTRGGLALFGASAIYASFGPLVRVLSDMFGDYTQVAARMGLAFIFLLVVALAFKLVKKLSLAQIGYSVLLGVISIGIVASFTMAVIEIKIATTVFLLYAASMVSSLILGTLLFKESLGFQKILALVLAFVGLWMFGDILTALTFGVFAALFSGVCEGLGNVVRKKLKGVDKTTVLLYQFFVSSAGALILAMLFLEPMIKEISTGPIIALTVFALLQLGLNNLLLFGFQHFDVNIGTVILSLELFFAAILGFLIFGENLSMSELFGGIAIFTASVISAWEFKKPVSNSSSFPVATP
jgi:drug/metabolite transporter (DMT)-like permease